MESLEHYGLAKNMTPADERIFIARLRATVELRESDRSREAVETEGLDPKDESAVLAEHSPETRAALTAETKIPGREEIARAVFRTMFHKDDPDEIVAQKWVEWPESQRHVYLVADAVLALLPVQAEEWKDIESAPKDGTNVLCCVAGMPRSVGEAYWWQGEDGRGGWQTWDGELHARTVYSPGPTHWRPLDSLPPPPDLKSTDTVTK